MKRLFLCIALVGTIQHLGAMTSDEKTAKDDKEIQSIIEQFDRINNALKKLVGGQLYDQLHQELTTTVHYKRYPLVIYLFIEYGKKNGSFKGIDITKLHDSTTDTELRTLLTHLRNNVQYDISSFFISLEKNRKRLKLQRIQEEHVHLASEVFS